MSTETTTKRHKKYVVARVDEIPVGERRLVEINGREIGVFNIKGKFYAMLNRCPHLGGPLYKGQLVNNVVSNGPGDISLDESQTLLTCPWHNWEFDIGTGQSYWDPKHTRARPFGVEVEQGQSVADDVESGSLGRIEGPYRAETIEVSVESDYVVLSMRPQRPGTAPKPAAPEGCQSPPMRAENLKEDK